VRVCQEVVVNQVLDFAHRGAHAEVVCDDDRPMGLSSCVQCGMCVQVCPVGALTFKERRGEARSWETTNAKVTCPYCGVGCQIDVDVAENRIVSANAHMHRWQEQPNQGMLCVKGRFGLGFSHAPDRLVQPLVRKNGELEPVSWDEALDRVADRLRAIRDEHGPDSLGFFTSAKVSNEDNYVMSRFARAVIGTNNLDHCARL
jgi:predicted molibdopterin-dependent oxidoreductase YjgC